ncbi:hypothetical protein DVH24_016541 [Malus domestica]|uniref:Uncharacterized protein n=1 Tax=Malus domestica TaxID=3750 RepID=A0A498HSG3_MALDO|nr:hypothetical protein DVH24_016541 [Malus domestica]
MVSTMLYSSIGFSFTRKKLKRCRHLAPSNATPLVELELPLLPFPLNESELRSGREHYALTNLATIMSAVVFEHHYICVLVPSESKALHLYEARYLALLEDVLCFYEQLFVSHSIPNQAFLALNYMRSEKFMEI